MTCGSVRCRALPTLGRSTVPVVMSGAVTMKMISSTSITSMNGTMLISLMVRRRLPRWPMRAWRGGSARRAGSGAGVALQDVRELLDEALELDRRCGRCRGRSGCRRSPPGSRRTGRSRWRPAPRRCPGATVASVTCCRFDRPMKACMMPHTVPNRPTYGRDRADRREERQVRLDGVQLALEARAHRPARAVEQRAGVGDALLAQLEELAHARGEDALHRRVDRLLGGVGVEVVEVAAGPELALEVVVGRQRTRRRPNSLPKITVQLASDASISPAITTCTTMLAWRTSVTIEKSWFIGVALGRMSLGIRRGRKVPSSTQPMRIVPSASNRPARSACCVTLRLACPRCDTVDADIEQVVEPGRQRGSGAKYR